MGVLGSGGIVPFWRQIYGVPALLALVFQANTKHLYNIATMLDQRLRRWSSIVYMLYKCVALAGLAGKTASFLSAFLPRVVL